MTRAAKSAAVADEAAFERAYAGTLRFYPEVLASLGHDADGLLAEAGIDATILAAPLPYLSFRAIVGLLERTAAVTGLADFGMRLARYQGGGRVFGPTGVVMRNSSTLGEAMEYAAAHIRTLSIACTMRIERDAATGGMRIPFDILLDRLPVRCQTIEQLLLLSHHNAMEITGGRARARQVRFRHHPQSPLRTYRDYFGCEVLFDQDTNGLVFSREDMAAPIVDADSRDREIATGFIERSFPSVATPMHAQVRGLIRRDLGATDCGIARIADELHLHPRTLHRRLRGERRSFEGIKDAVRRDVAYYYLGQTDVPLTRISEKLGYSETSVLSRSCLRWFGSSPRVVRSRMRGGVAA